MKRKENQAAECLSRLFPIYDPEIEKKYDIDTEQLPSSSTDESTKKRYMGVHELISEDEQDSTTDADPIEKLLQQYHEWCKDKTITLVKEKPNAGGKLQRKISKERVGTKQEIHYNLPVYNEKEWLRVIHEIYTDGINNKLTIIRYHFVDPTLTPVEKLKLKYILNFLSNKNTGQRFYICLTPRTELTQEEKKEIIREAYGTLTSQHCGENKSVEKARELGEWIGDGTRNIRCTNKFPPLDKSWRHQ